MRCQPQTLAGRNVVAMEVSNRRIRRHLHCPRSAAHGCFQLNFAAPALVIAGYKFASVAPTARGPMPE